MTSLSESMRRRRVLFVPELWPMVLVGGHRWTAYDAVIAGGAGQVVGSTGRVQVAVLFEVGERL